MAGNISYYFTLFKKFQVLNHVPEQTVHGAPSGPTGNFQLNDPSSVFGGSATFGSLLGATPGASPLWQLLNAAAIGGPGPSGIPPMPLGASSSSPPSWVAFQYPTNPPPIVTVFSDWITGGKINDIPNGVVNPHGGAINNVPVKNPGPLDSGRLIVRLQYAERQRRAPRDRSVELLGDIADLLGGSCHMQHRDAADA